MEAVMLSEIYFLKLEAAKRAAEEAGRAENARYTPLAPSIVPGKTVAGASQSNTAPPQR
jgi:hypothetical protein